jgi:cbb3-type cytochrome oxidase cytochrome c subunit
MKGCSRCHQLSDGAGGVAQAPTAALASKASTAGGKKAKVKAPDLTVVGRKREREWIMAHIRNPKSHSPDSPMPSYEQKISDSELEAIGDFLSSLK